MASSERHLSPCCDRSLRTRNRAFDDRSHLDDRSLIAERSGGVGCPVALGNGHVATTNRAASRTVKPGPRSGVRDVCVFPVLSSPFSVPRYRVVISQVNGPESWSVVLPVHEIHLFNLLAISFRTELQRALDFTRATNQPRCVGTVEARTPRPVNLTPVPRR